MKSHVFALDIGTRSVTGILMEKIENNFSIIDTVTKEHTERSMRDGQIMHVVQVAEIIHIVKETLENRNNLTLKTVCVAAAGRALQTTQASTSLNLNEQPIKDEQRIKHMELSAVQSAQTTLSVEEEHGHANYFCVGYSVLHYRLDGEIIGSLIDQNGKVASVDIIATFLPKVVIDSLLASLSRADLEMEALTLEPIAAIGVLIPESMRRLNVALVDIGAGTSDIAITNDGTITAYGMVPIAGDEITEAISDQYLLDFPKAEQAKRDVVNDDKAIIQDILGFDETLTKDSLTLAITTQVNMLAKAITDEIITLNTKPPKAVMLIGGGSLTPTIASTIANKLHLTPNRVAIRGVDAIQNLTSRSKIPTGPDYVTPIGIAVTATKNPIHYLTINVNDKKIRMFASKQLTIGDTLVQAGISIGKWYGKPGIAKFITLNRKKTTIPGVLGKPPVITKNNVPATVEDHIQNGDQIRITKGVAGHEPTIQLKDLTNHTNHSHITFNKEKFSIGTTFIVNQEIKDENDFVEDGDVIVIRQIHTIRELMDGYFPHKEIAPFQCLINRETKIFEHGQPTFILNNVQVDASHILHQGDILKGKAKSVTEVSVMKLMEWCNQQYWYTLPITFNGQHITLKQPAIHVWRENQILTETDIVKRDDQLRIEKVTYQSFIFQDVFRYVDIDLAKVNGHFQLYQNSLPTTFHSELSIGDQLELKMD